MCSIFSFILPRSHCTNGVEFFHPDYIVQMVSILSAFRTIHRMLSVVPSVYYFRRRAINNAVKNVVVEKLETEKKRE